MRTRTMIAAALVAVSLPVYAADPVLLSAVSRKVHGPAGTFDIPLSEVTSTIEPRTGPLSIVFVWDRAITQAECYAAEGLEVVAGAAVIHERTVTCPVTSGLLRQWVSVNVVVSDGSGYAEALVRVGLLPSDVNGSGAVTVADLARVQRQIAQPVTQSTFRHDVNANGAITVSDYALTQTRIATGLQE